MHSRSESCLGILLRNHIMEPTLVICHNVNGDHQLGCGLSSLLYNHCALFFSFTTISNLWGDTLRPCKCPAAYPLMRFSINWWFLLDLMFIMVVTIYVCVCVCVYIYMSILCYLSIHHLSFFYWHKFMNCYFFSCLQYILVLNYLVAKIVPTLAKGSPPSYFLCLCDVSQSLFILLSTFLFSGISYHLISYLPTLP